METAAKLIVISFFTMLAFETASGVKLALRGGDNIPEHLEKTDHLPPLSSPILLILVPEPYSSGHNVRKSSSRPWVEVGPGVFKPDKLEFDENKFPKEIKYLLEMKTKNQDGEK